MAAPDTAFPTTAFVDSGSLLADPAALHGRARRDGYLLLRGLVDRRAIADLRRDCLDAAGERGWLAAAGTDRARPGVRLFEYDDPACISFLQQVLVRPAFGALRTAPAILAAATAAMGAPARPREADICRVFSPGTPELATRPHQDFHFLGPPENGWTVWLALGDCPLDLGPIAVLPGSHLQGPQPHAGRGQAKYVDDAAAAGPWATGPLAAGDAVLFHSLTLHRALPNRSAGRLRLSADFRYLPAGGEGA